jgi:hypothetical protein
VRQRQGALSSRRQPDDVRLTGGSFFVMRLATVFGSLLRI